MSKAIENFLLEARQQLIQQQLDRGLTASNASIQSLKITMYGNNEGELTGNSYYYQLVHGRRPGKYPGKTLEEAIDNMLKWILVKGITPDDPKTSLRSLAFLFARKIAMSGTDIFQGKKRGLDIDLVIKNTIDKLKEGASLELGMQIIAGLRKKKTNEIN